MSVNSYVCKSTVLPNDNNSVDSYLNESCKMIKVDDVKNNMHLLHLPMEDKKTNIYVCFIKPLICIIKLTSIYNFFFR